jgi:hypothetical protein
MAVFRFLTYLFLLVAVVALVSDATPTSRDDQRFEATSLAEHLSSVAPMTLEGTKSTVSTATFPWVWTYVVGPVLAMPTFLLFGLAAALCGYLGRRRHRVNIYVN